MVIQSIYQPVLEYNLKGLMEAVKRELNGGTDVSAIVKDGLVAALDEIGRKFSDGKLYVPEMLMAAKCVKAGMDIIRPLIGSGQESYSGTVIIGTVAGDLHDIGKNLVAMMLEGGGFKVIDLGVDVKKEAFAEATKKHKAGIVALSALLTTTLTAMKETVAYLKSQEQKVSIMVGGAPVDQKFSDGIGADGCADDAAGAVVLARNLLAM